MCVFCSLFKSLFFSSNFFLLSLATFSAHESLFGGSGAVVLVGGCGIVDRIALSAVQHFQSLTGVLKELCLCSGSFLSLMRPGVLRVEVGETTGSS